MVDAVAQLVDSHAVAARREHLAMLAREARTRLVYVGIKEEAMHYVELGYVQVPEPVTLADYFTCLHELGHAAHGDTQGRPGHEAERAYFDKGVLKCEALAWEYALDHANEQLDTDAVVFAIFALRSYARAAREAGGMWTTFPEGHGDRHHAGFAWDEPGPEVARVLLRLLDALDDTPSTEPGR